uniref:ATPase cation transporting 13A2 n=1 Tax=Terrapene triunguis TaxID=2587831 RepID=A0A674KEN4_9SAUR
GLRTTGLEEQNGPSGLGTCANPPSQGKRVELRVSGYQSRTWRIILCYMFSVLTAGILLIVFRWKPSLEVRAKCRPCALRHADWIIITDRFGQCFVTQVQTEQLGEGSLEPHPGARADDGRTSVAVGVLDEDDSRDTVRLHRKEEVTSSLLLPKNVVRYYLFEGSRYVWIERRQAYCKVRYGIHPLVWKNFSFLRKVYGPNLIDVPVKSYLRLLVDEVLNPFYIFQVFSIILWLCDAYYYYAACIFVISAISIGLSLYETRKQSVTLQSMVKMAIGVRVHRAAGEEAVVSSLDLVPGDCISLPSDGFVVPCDAALLTGECMVNESMLTGESVPVMKTPLPSGPQAANMIYSPEEHKRHTLFCGTQVLQAKSYVGKEVLAVVTRTGFCTAKGDLISSILYPKPVSFRFYRDAVKFVLFLAVLALIGTTYSIVILIRNQVPLRQIIIRALDLITVIVPPALPAAMTVGTIYAQNRLKRHGIFCISPPRINLCGKIRLVCFDKTGTLTEEGLDVWGVVPVENNCFLPIVHEPRCLADGPLLYSLATCHSVSLLREQPIGDPMDLKMVESTGWVRGRGPCHRSTAWHCLGISRIPFPPQKHKVSAGILRRFPFSSSLQRMSVLVKLPGDAPSEAYIKGAPEMVASLCKEETVPLDFSQLLRHYTTDGFRVLGLAYKTLPTVKTFEEAQQLTRDAVESGMTLLGFLVMRNVLKAETAPVIHLLRNANIRTVMVTGDNMLTAMNVAKSCRMVELKERVVFVNASPPSHDKPAALKFILSDDPQGQEQPQVPSPSGLVKLVALHGPGAFIGRSQRTVSAFNAMCPTFYDPGSRALRFLAGRRWESFGLYCSCGRVSCRSYCVGMCGDGANDCGALKAADVGISLSEAEASVASPFTSRIANIECVPMVIREGRCSLVTSFGVFKYMALYSLVQFVSVLLLYTINTNLSDFQFLFFDLVITMTVAVLMGKTGPAKELGTKRPQGALISIVVLGSLLLQTALLITVQVMSYFITVSQSWYVPLNSTVSAPQNLPNYENTVVFCISGFQYLILAVAMSKGYPFREPLYTNVPFLLVLVALFGLTMGITLYPLGFVKAVLKLKDISDMSFKMLLLGMATLNFFTAFMLEAALDHGMLNCLRQLRQKRASKKLFKRLEQELSQQPPPSWPPLNEPLFATPKLSISGS